MKSVAFRLFAPMVRLATYAPIGRRTLTSLFLKLSSNSEMTQSVYGPILQTRHDDLTFRFCVTGAYGRYLSDFLSDFPVLFSFLDIGANIGLYSLIAAANPKCHACYAFEPNPDVFASLERNILLNGHSKIQAYNTAISATQGTLAFSARRDHSGAGSLDPAGTMTVRTVNRSVFDDIATVDRVPKVVKIDVEGHEPAVLAELLGSTLVSQVNNIYFEAHESRYDVSAAVALLESAGFRQTHKEGNNIWYDLMFERVRS